ncbi:hypothetical protein ACFXDH_30055 [Streptomyces sp. NPDC059467]
MTITELPDAFEGVFTVELPARPCVRTASAPPPHA